MEAWAIRLMRAIKHRYPGVQAGDLIDPYIAAAQFPYADLDPEGPGYQAALRELQDDDVLREAPSDLISGTIRNMDQQYEVTPEGERWIADA